MGTRQSEQASLWVATAELPKSPGHPFYTRLNALLDADDFDRFVEGQCTKFYAPVMGRPSLAPGRYFRLLLVGYFEGIDSEIGKDLGTDTKALKARLTAIVDRRNKIAHEADMDPTFTSRPRMLVARLRPVAQGFGLFRRFWLELNHESGGSIIWAALKP